MLSRTLSDFLSAPLFDPHAFLFHRNPKNNPTRAEDYEKDCFDRCRYGSAAAVGPDHWYISKVDAYASKSRLQHEVLVATLKRTPRMGQKRDHTEHQVALQRLMKHHKHVIQHMKNADALSSNLEELWSEEQLRMPFCPTISLNAVEGICPTNDGFQLLPFVGLDDDSKHITQIHLPEPPCLPPANDYQAILDKLDEQKSLIKAIRRMEEVKLTMEEERHSAPRAVTSVTSNDEERERCLPDDATAILSQDLPHYVSLTAFGSLAYILHDDKDFYHKLSNDNCYWLTSMVLHVLRLYTEQNIRVIGEKDVEIGWDEDLSDPKSTPLQLRALKKKKFGRTARYHSKLKHALGIVNAPSNLGVRNTIVSWRRRVEDFYEKIHYGRSKKLRKLIYLESPAGANAYRGPFKYY